MSLKCLYCESKNYIELKCKYFNQRLFQCLNCKNKFMTLMTKEELDKIEKTKKPKKNYELRKFS